MAYSPLPAKVTTDTITITNYDAIKGNFEAGVPDLFTTKGDLVAATGADAGARLAVGADDATLVPDSAQTTGLAWQIQPAARVYNSANLALGAAAWTYLTFDTERFDTDAMHSTGGTNGRFTIPAGGAGLYSIGACVQFDVNSIGTGLLVGVRLMLNGTTVIAQATHAGDFANPLQTTIVISTLYALNVSDYVDLQAYSSQALNVLKTANYSPEYWINFERRQ